MNGEDSAARGDSETWFRVVLVGVVLALLAFVSTGPARRAFDAALVTVFPHRVTMQVAPGNVRVKAGSPLGINARLVGGGTPSSAQVEMGDGTLWRAVDMTPDRDGRFRLRIDAIDRSFKYRVLAGSVTSPTYTVTLVYPPTVTHVTLDYSYPDALGLKPRHTEGRGDIDAPEGTNVRLCVHTDRPVGVGVLAFANGERVALSSTGPTSLSAALTIAGNNAYRVVLAGADGVRNDGDVEYLIRAIPR